MYSRRPLIYARYSSDLQSDKCNEDQDREVRALFRRLGIDDTDAFVFYDAAESGTKNDRPKFLEALELVRQGRVSVFGVDAKSSRRGAGPVPSKDTTQEVHERSEGLPSDRCGR